MTTRENRLDPKPVSDKSEWLNRPREGFTKAMEQLFLSKPQPSPGVSTLGFAAKHGNL